MSPSAGRSRSQAGSSEGAGRTRGAAPSAAGKSSGMPALRKRDVLLDPQVRRQSLVFEPGPRLESFGAFELSRAHRRVDALLDLALRADTKVFQKLAHGQIEGFFVHGVTLKT